MRGGARGRATAKTRIFGERGRPRAGFETWSTYLFLRSELVLDTGINGLINGRILLLFFPLTATLKELVAVNIQPIPENTTYAR